MKHGSLRANVGLPELNRRGIEAIERTAGLYAIEKKIRGLSADERRALQAKPKANRQPAKQEIKQADKKPERPSAQPQVHQEVSSTPSHGGGTMIGVGF